MYEELRGSPPENSCPVSQQVKDGATAPAGQRHPQCVVSDLAFHVIRVKVISVIIGNSLKNLFWSFAWQYANNSTISQGPSAFFTGTYDYNWLHNTIDSIYMVRHVKIVIIPYQWLKVEQKNACLL